MTENERQAALAALSAILKQPLPTSSSAGNGTVPKEFADAWNKIMATLDNDKVSEADLKTLLAAIENGQVTEI